MRELGIDASEICLTGGGAGSLTWRRVVSDVCNAPVTVLEQDEGASFGAALQALSVLNDCEPDDFQQLVDQHLTRNETLCCEPKSSAVNFYNETFASYRQAVRTITPLYT